MKRTWLIFSFWFLMIANLSGQGFFLNGIVRDASSYIPIPDVQISVNGAFSGISDKNGTFGIIISGNDTVIFSSLGYKPASLHADSLMLGREYLAGVYMHADTVSAGEVVIMPRLTSLKSEIMNAGSREPAVFDNARYNVAVSAYQGRTTTGSLGDPANNYAVLAGRQKMEAYERGGIPSDKMVSLSPLMLVPAAYLLVKGLPQAPAPYKAPLSGSEIDGLHRKYLEMIRSR